MKQQLTTYEKYAIISILSQIMKADGIIHPKEEEFMDQAYCELGITINDLEGISNMDILETKHIIDGMSATNKEYARKLFVGMAESDGFLHPREVDVINKILNS